jgi:hypothetical protein
MKNKLLEILFEFDKFTIEKFVLKRQKKIHKTHIRDKQNIEPAHTI